ncbi:MAG: ATP-binding protein [Acidobacteriota bacterium]
MAKPEDRFSFEISLSVLNHLGRNLYRSFMTVLGEAISNSWDADAENVWIYINKSRNSLVIKDDGIGMDGADFQSKFLKIGYSKRSRGKTYSDKDRPFIGRKGIGKLALLSCAKTISVLSKKINAEYVGGIIDNSGLDKAIKKDLTPDKYQLRKVAHKAFKKFEKDHKQGTIIYFEGINDGIKKSADSLKKLIALYFRFSLFDNTFSIYVDDEKVTLEHLDDLANKTQFLWIINDLDDPFIKDKIANGAQFRERRSRTEKKGIRGFIASVVKPSQLKIMTTEEKISVDLFVNGRLREKDILKHIPSTRVVESYLYGQVHFDALDDKVDRFASSREGVVADDPKYASFLEDLKKIIFEIMEEWDKLRNEINQDGDPDNPRITRKARKSKELFNVVSEEYSLPKESGNKGKVDQWVNELSEDAPFNFSSHAECFVSENLVRKYIDDKQIQLSPEARREIKKWKDRETDSKNRANISIDIRRSNVDLSYLSMDDLANLVDKKDPIKEAALSRDAYEYKPMRDALAHTALLTDVAKNRLTTVYENIKARTLCVNVTETPTSQ